MGAMVRAAVRVTEQGHPSLLWACAMVIGFTALFSFLVYFVFRKNVKPAFERASQLPLMEDRHER